MKRKIAVSLLAMCMVTGMFTGCGSQQREAQESTQTVEQQQTSVETMTPVRARYWTALLN